MSFDVVNEDIIWLQKKYPDLKFFPGTPPIIKGLFKFDALYKDKNGNCPDLRIKDAYEIEIVLSNKLPSILPQVKETGGRIKKSKEKYNKATLADVHMYPDETVCFCTYPEEQTKLINGFNLKDFFEGLLTPYFYAQSYFEKKGDWVWGERSHGTLGLLESYMDNRGDGSNIVLIQNYINYLKQLSDSVRYYQVLLEKNQLKGHVPCYCGSQLKFRRCHRYAFKGLWNLKEDIRNNKIII